MRYLEQTVCMLIIKTRLLTAYYIIIVLRVFGGIVRLGADPAKKTAAALPVSVQEGFSTAGIARDFRYRIPIFAGNIYIYIHVHTYTNQ